MSQRKQPAGASMMNLYAYSPGGRGRTRDQSEQCSARPGESHRLSSGMRSLQLLKEPERNAAWHSPGHEKAVGTSRGRRG